MHMPVVEDGSGYEAQVLTEIDSWRLPPKERNGKDMHAYSAAQRAKIPLSAGFLRIRNLLLDCTYIYVIYHIYTHSDRPKHCFGRFLDRFV